MVMVPGIGPVVLQIARVIEAVLLQLVRLVGSVLLELVCLIEAVLLGLRRVLVPFRVVLVPRARVLREATGVMDAAPTAAAEACVGSTIEKAAVAEPRATERFAA